MVRVEHSADGIRHGGEDAGLGPIYDDRFIFTGIDGKDIAVRLEGFLGQNDVAGCLESKMDPSLQPPDPLARHGLFVSSAEADSCSDTEDGARPDSRCLVADSSGCEAVVVPVGNGSCDRLADNAAASATDLGASRRLEERRGFPPNVGPGYDSYIDAMRKSAGLSTQAVVVWRKKYVQGGSWMAPHANRFLKHCQDQDINPKDFRGGDLVNWVIENYREGSWDNVVTSVSTLFQNAHGDCSIKWDGFVKGVAKAGRASAKKRRQVREIFWLGAIFQVAQDLFEKHKGILEEVPDKELSDMARAILVASTGMRPSDAARLPLYEYPRQPTSSDLGSATEFSVQLFWPKEERLRDGGVPWSGAIHVCQRILGPSRASLPGVWLQELARRLALTRGFPTENHVLEGRGVRMQNIFTRLTPKQKLVISPPLSADTVSNSVQRVMDLAKVPIIFSPRDCRSAVATYLFHVLVKKDLMSRSKYQALFRHKPGSSVTKEHYERGVVAQSIVVRWDALDLVPRLVVSAVLRC